MSSYGVIEENMEMSHIYLVVIQMANWKNVDSKMEKRMEKY